MRDKFVKQENRKVISVERIVTVLYMEYSKDFVFAGEAHDFWEFTYIDKGSVVFTADSREFLLKGGEIAFHKPNEFHKLAAFNVPPNVTIVSFVCKSEAMKFFENKIFKLSAEERNVLSALLKEGMSAFEPLTKKPPVMGMKEKPNAPKAARQLTFNLLEQFLAVLLRRSDSAIARESRSVSRIEKSDYPDQAYEILVYLEKNIGEQLTVSEIAEHFSMSESAFKKYFSKYFKCGVIEKFNDMKLKHAGTLIRERNLNFTEIAEVLGFSSVHYFSRLFKKHTGMTPSEYSSSVKTEL